MLFCKEFTVLVILGVLCVGVLSSESESNPATTAPSDPSKTTVVDIGAFRPELRWGKHKPSKNKPGHHNKPNKYEEDSSEMSSSSEDWEDKEKEKESDEEDDEC